VADPRTAGRAAESSARLRNRNSKKAKSATTLFLRKSPVWRNNFRSIRQPLQAVITPIALNLHTGRNPGEVLDNDRDDCLNVQNFVLIIFGGLPFLSSLVAMAYTFRSRLAWKVMLDSLRIINQSVVLL
jgi:hypothetical protein